MAEKLLLSHGGGGEETYELISKVILKYFGNPILNSLEDAGVVDVPPGKIAFTTDGFTVNPLFFKGGDIGKLAVTGTINDLVMMGAEPLYLTVSFVVEEGFEFKLFEKVLKSMKKVIEEIGVKVVAGDTKIVPKGAVDKMFITTSGIGKVILPGISCKALKPGDAIVVSGGIGEHGACIMAEREGIKMELDLESDCEVLWPLLKPIILSGIEIHAMRDPTRGGLAATLYEWAFSSKVNILIEEEKVPVKPQVKAFCEALGFEPYHLACEGRVVIAVPEKEVESLLSMLREHPSGKDAQVIGKVLEHAEHPKVIMQTLYGTERIMENTSGEMFPRIC